MTRAVRRGYLDWMRGLAVLIMIEAHTIDSWTRAADRRTTLFGYAMIAGGFGAPIFLFLAGLAVTLSAGSKARKSGTVAAGAAAVRRRGWEIFGLAFLFRLQSYILTPGGALAGLLKVDILNIMTTAIVFVWDRRPWAPAGAEHAGVWSPMREFGRASLFVYWIHVEMVYGVLTQPLHKRLPIGWAFAAFTLFSLFLFGIAMSKNALVARWQERRPRAAPSAVP